MRARRRWRLAGRVEQQAAERDYYATLLERLQHCARRRTASRSSTTRTTGSAGRSRSGRRSSWSRAPEDIELEVHLPASDPLLLAAGDALLFFPNVAPDRPLGAWLRVIGYARCVPGADGVAAYRLKASLDAGRTGNAADLRPWPARHRPRLWVPTPRSAPGCCAPLAVLARWLNPGAL